MTLATKNGSLIVKDGKIAENCGCCGDGWYCCAEKACVLNGATSATITIQAQDYLRWSNYKISVSDTRYESYSFLGSEIAGTYSLTANTSSPKSWGKNFSYLSLPNGGLWPGPSVYFGTRYDIASSSEQMMLTMQLVLGGRELQHEEYRDLRNYQQTPGGYMGFLNYYHEVPIYCPAYSGSAQMSFNPVYPPGSAWASTLTPPVIVLEQGSSNVTISVEWS
jgi:hypothetical protein